MRITAVVLFVLLFSTTSSAVKVGEYEMFEMEEEEGYSYVVEESGETVTFGIERSEQNKGQGENPFTVFYSDITGESRRTTGYDDLGSTLAAYADTTAVIEDNGVNYTYLINCGNNAYGELPKNAVIVEKGAGGADYPALPTSSENHDFCKRLNEDPLALSSKGIQEVHVSSSDPKIYLDTGNVYASEDIESDYRIDLKLSVGETDVELDTSFTEYRSKNLRIEGFQKPIDIGIGETEAIADDLFMTREGDWTYNLNYREGKSDKKYLDRNLMYCGLNVNDCEGAELSTLQTEDNGPIEVKYERIHEDVTEYASGTEEVNEQRVEVSVEGEKIFEIQDNQGCENMFETAERSGYTFVVTRDLCDSVKKEVGWSRDRGTKYNELNKARVTVLPENPGRAAFGTSTNFDEVDLFGGIETEYGNFYVAQIQGNAVEIYDKEDNQYFSLGEGERRQIGDNEELRAFLKVEGVDETVSFDIQEERKPDADLGFNSETYYPGSEGELSYEVNVDGSYVLKIRKDGDIITESNLDRNSGDQEFSIEDGGSSLEAEVVAPSAAWNIFSSDEVVASDTASVEDLPSDTVGPEIGGTVNISISEDEVIEFRDTYIEAEHSYRTRSTYQRDPYARDGVDINILRNSLTYNINPSQEFNLGSQENAFQIKLCSFEKITEGDYAKFAFGELEASTEELRSVCESDSTAEEDSSSEDLLVEIGCNSDSVSPGDTVSCFVDEFPDTRLGEFEWSVENGGNIADRTLETATIEVPEDTDSKRFTVMYNLQASGASISDSFQVETSVDGENPDSRRDSEDPERIGDASNYPRDPDNDGLYEDVNGDGELRVSDSELLFYNIESAPTEYFDFNEDGNMNVADAQVLYNLISDEPRENSITVQTDNIQTGDDVNIQIKTKLTLADRGYQIVVENPEGEKILDGTSKEITQTNTFTPEQSGEYTVNIYPSGRLQSIIRRVTGPLKSKTFSISSNQPTWINYCRTNNYGIEGIQEKANCIKNEIIPKYFEDSTGSSPEVAESLCQDLLGYSYNDTLKQCQ